MMDALEEACRGLTFISETDAELLPFHHAFGRGANLKLAGQTARAPVEEPDFEEFFARLTIEKDWFGDEEKQRAERFARLRGVLREHLRDLRILRSGRIHIDILIAGIDQSGHLAGVRTWAVET